MLKLMDFPFAPSNSRATMRMLAAEYMFWPARGDDGADVAVFVRRKVLEDVLGLVDERPGRERTDILRDTLLKHRRRIEEAANVLYLPDGQTPNIFLEPIDFNDQADRAQPSLDLDG
jgi:hypothetical protein